MKLRYLLLGAAVTLCFGVIPRNADAQIFSFFTSTLKNIQYQEVEDGQLLPASAFQDPQTRFVDPDDGYYFDVSASRFGYTMPFEFEYDGTRQTRVHINVNGFITFGTPNRLGSNIPDNLFTRTSPNSVIAPFWGNHYYRTTEPGFVRSSILVKVEGTAPERVLTIEWKNLNINYFFDPLNVNDPLSPGAAPQPTSVGTFQVKLFESVDAATPKEPGSKQGNIEFHYSTVGDPSVPGVIKTSGAAVGVESGVPVGSSTGQTTFLNGLFIENPPDSERRPEDTPENARNNRTTTATWAPSRRNNNVICFESRPVSGATGWGDGDANLSQLPRGIHSGMPQNRFVTVTDVITILRSSARNRPLDSARLRNAYHADVNHNGRFYYSQFDANLNPVPTYRREVTTKSVFEFDDLPPGDLSFTVLFFQANEFDAALILNYIAAKIPTLPWLLDTVIDYGKSSAVHAAANNIELAYASTSGLNTYRVPVYLNGVNPGPLGFAFDVNGTVTDVQLAKSDDVEIHTQYFDNRVIVAGTGQFTADEPIAYVTVESDAQSMRFSNIRFNDVAKESVELPLATSVDDPFAGGRFGLKAYPNPFVSDTEIAIIAPENGFYTLAVYNSLGARVKTLVNQQLKAGPHSIVWDGTDERGISVQSGMYFYRLEGVNVNESNTVNLVR